MKSPIACALSLRFAFGLLLAFAGTLQPVRAEETPQLNPDQLDQLLGPIALYPDALVALILPASTVPSDVALAQRYLSGGGDPEQIDYQPWNESVKGLARYPMLIQWLDENLAWTQQLGNAFLNQPDAVMESVQRLRARARANGSLTSTPQQKLVLDGDIIEIVPAQPDVIYVPYYDPNLVYGQSAYYGGAPYVTFGVGFAAGYWLAYDFNWHSHIVVVGDRHHNWYEHHDWNHHSGPGGKPNYGNNWHPWTPPVKMPPSSRPDSHRSPPGVTQPRPLPRGPSSPASPEHPNAGSHSRENDHNHPPTPPGNPAWNQGNRPPPSSGPQHGPYPQPGPPVSAPQSGPPLPAPNPQSGNPPRPSGPPNPSSPGPRPGTGPQPHGGPHQPGPNPTHPPPARPPGPAPVAPPPAYPASPPPAPPPPAPKDGPRDEKPEVQR